jgi:proline dehydrogenase
VKITKQALMPQLDFSNTEIAFAHLSDQELKKTAWLFRIMSRPWLVQFGSAIGLKAIEWRLPYAEAAVRHTIFEQFVGGTTLLNCQPSIDRLVKNNTLTILDYGAEAKEREEDFNHTMNENIRAIEYAGRAGGTIPVISTKITGLARFELLERIQLQSTMSREELSEYRNVLKRVDTICYTAANKGVSVFIDAEESWIQDTLDHMVWMMMKRYNKERVVVYNTYQMYRHDRLQFLIESYDRAQKAGFLLGAKLVRGAYMEKERNRAGERGYASPINADKGATDDMYNTALRFCIDHIDQIGLCNASHNAESSQLLAELMVQKGLSKDHPNVLFSQLFGMSDNLTFNLAKAGYRVAKYVPYGQVHDVIPYLIRRAQENTSVTGDASRELQLIEREISRRGL